VVVLSKCYASLHRTDPFDLGRSLTLEEAAAENKEAAND